ncbi:AI-2E family transporter [Leucobacter sp. OH2974_COT-288]|nr:AI-2E family transporter [Leucobacter sp. OH2974_COT-288]
MFGCKTHKQAPELPVVTPKTLWSDTIGKLATRSLQTMIVIGIGALAIWGLAQVSTVAIPLLLAVILAATFNPLMQLLRSKGVPALGATAIVLLGTVAVLGGVGWMIVNAVINQWDKLAESAASGFNQIIEFVQGLPFADSIDSVQLEQWQQQAMEFVTSSKFGSNAVAVGGAVGGAVGNFFAGFVLLVVILFFFLKDGKEIWEFLCRPFHGEHYDRAMRVGKATVETFGSYIRGTAIVAAVDAVGIGIGLFILQVPLALPLAVLVFVLSFVPLVGATIAGILAALVALVSNGMWSAIIVIAIVVVVNQLEGNFLQPVVMGRALKLHPLVILLALTVGTVLAKILGAVLAVPIVAAVWAAIKVWDGPNKPASWAREKHPGLQE